ncbi:MAG TPA: DUF3501 family protein [Pyrinomonadaceae bacterium]|nr:DUF3501 family protein [Pyrinomonadaceae bacterium]
MKKVQREGILDYVTYEEQRTSIRESAMRAKDARRVHCGDHLTFLFENTETIRYQVLEMVRAEKIVREADIRHEIDTYNELIGDAGEICATLLIEIEDVDDRARKLTEWVGLPERIYLKLDTGERTFARPDNRQNEDAKISSVQFLKFICGSGKPVAIGTDHPKLSIESNLSESQKAALAGDLGND